MAVKRSARHKALAWAAILLLAGASRLGVAAPPLEDVARGVHVDVGQISVSGISSGGFMAHQFHVAHSAHILGAGIVAGGPYYCARGNILDAVTRCSQFVMLQCVALGLDPRWCSKTDLAPRSKGAIETAAQESFAEALRQQGDGTIDPLTNLKQAHVYLFSGIHDENVPQGVMDTLFRFYTDADKGGVAQSQIEYSRTFPARHTMVRDGFDKPAGNVVGNCPLPPTPAPPIDRNAFIDDCEAVARTQQQKEGCICPASPAPTADCPPEHKETVCRNLRDVDLAGAILRRLYGEQALRGGRVDVAEDAVQAFDQAKVFAIFSKRPYNALQNASMAREGYLFVPEPCRDGRRCRLHVAFHGCLQGGLTDHRSGHAGNLYAKYAGYNEWARANEIIVLYPQIQARASIPLNPQGCWDWWGQNYTHQGYHTKRGKQIKAVAQMINVLAGGGHLLEVEADD
ncbi:hypothetical protein [Accumulibacter sp.]|uniref:hypothetical protein n=1 Tax=Accumulibacter sp. TaxID=2053492 RepID=UPI0025F7A55A|nr:hypothetical protein [Accumulibacter sp.]MCM8594623.1 PHB depolymerase family esterase [Accumulibacter sp.]MCM8627260.1 PHB depolymerase family esterase [Accumulibacter sp.]MDS4048769.1 hypothetical protein [Accumulibacter sp.]